MLAAIAIILAGSGVTQAEELTKIDLTHAEAFATHTAGADEYDVRHVIDGNVATHWVGEGHPLTEHPTSIVIARAVMRRKAP